MSSAQNERVIDCGAGVGMEGPGGVEGLDGFDGLDGSDGSEPVLCDADCSSEFVVTAEGISPSLLKSGD